IRDFHVTGVQTCALPICLGFGERRRLELRVHRDLVEDDFMRLRVAADDRLEDEGNLQSLHRAKITLNNPDGARLAVHPPGYALRSEERRVGNARRSPCGG